MGFVKRSNSNGDIQIVDNLSEQNCEHNIFLKFILQLFENEQIVDKKNQIETMEKITGLSIDSLRLSEKEKEWLKS